MQDMSGSPVRLLLHLGSALGGGHHSVVSLPMFAQKGRWVCARMYVFTPKKTSREAVEVEPSKIGEVQIHT